MHANACAESEHTGFRQPLPLAFTLDSSPVNSNRYNLKPLPLDFGRYVVGRGRLVTVALQLGRYQWLAVTSARRGEQRSVKTVTTCAREIWVGGQTGQIHTGFWGFSGVVTGEGFEGRRAAGRVVTFIKDGRHAGF